VIHGLVDIDESVDAGPEALFQAGFVVLISGITGFHSGKPL